VALAMSMTGAMAPAVAPSIAAATALTGAAAVAAATTHASGGVPLVVLVTVGAVAIGLICICGWLMWRRNRKQEAA
jgi:hypothetical protein